MNDPRHTPDHVILAVAIAHDERRVEWVPLPLGSGFLGWPTSFDDEVGLMPTQSANAEPFQST